MVGKKELHRKQEIIRIELEAVGKKKGTESKSKLKGIILLLLEELASFQDT